MLASVHLPFCKRISHRCWNVNRFCSNFAQISQKISWLGLMFPVQVAEEVYWMLQDFLPGISPGVVRTKGSSMGLLVDGGLVCWVLLRTGQ